MKIRLILALVLMTFSVFGQNVPSYVPTNGLVGWWPFNGNANDESGNGNNGTVNGAVLTTDRFGNVNTAYSFDGIDDYINILFSSSLHGTTGTVNAWIKSNGQFASQKNIFSQAAGRPQLVAASQGMNSNQQTQFAGIQWKATSGQFPCAQSITTVDNSQWTMITGFYSEDTIQIYVNGVIESTYITNLIQDNCSTSDFQIGGFNTVPGCGNSLGYSQMFDGEIDEIGIWNRALTQQEITNLYNASLPSTSIPIFNCPGAFMSPQLASGLVGWWPFCGDAEDESGNGNNGTVYGATLTSDRFGNVNSAYEFDGNSVITVSNTTALNFSSPFSVSVWALKIGSEQTGHLLGKRNLCSDYQYQFGFDLSDPSFGVGWGGGGFGQFSYLQGVIPNFDTATWINYVGTFDGSNWKLYKNGISAGSLNAPLVNPVAADLLFGGSGSCQKFHGKLDDIGIWNRALDSSEVTQLYNTGLCTQTIAGSCDTLIFNANITGFNPVTYANQIKVYPNPASDNLVIDCGTNYTGLNGYSIRITNLLSQTVYNSPVTAQITNIQLTPPTWVNGTYVVQFVHPNGTVVETKRIIIQ